MDGLYEYDANEADLRMAEFCIATGVAPSEYKELTMGEIQAFIRVVNERNSKSK